MKQISVAQASEHLAQFIDAALKGEEIIITQGDRPVIKLVPLQVIPKLRPQFGSATGLLVMSDDFDDPLEDFKEYME